MTAIIRPVEGSQRGTLTGNLMRAATAHGGEFCPDAYTVEVIPLPTGGRYVKLTLSGPKVTHARGGQDHSGRRAERTWIMGDPLMPPFGVWLLRRLNMHMILDLRMAPELVHARLRNQELTPARVTRYDAEASRQDP